MRMRLVSSGYVNHNWIVQTARGKFVVRVAAKDRLLRELQFEHEVLCNLRNLPYTVPLPIPNLAGNTVTLYQGHRVWIYKYLEGEIKKKVSVPVVRQLALAIARLHVATEHLQTKHKKDWPSGLSRKRLVLQLGKLRFRRKSAVASFYTKHVAEVQQYVRQVHSEGYDLLRKQIIHSDIYLPNVLFKNNRITAIIDFDNLRRDSPVRDIACTAATFSKNGVMQLPMLQEYLRAYQTVRKLTKKELIYLPDLCLMEYAMAFYYFAYIIDKEPHRKVSLRQLQGFRTAVTWIANHKHEILQAAYSAVSSS